MNKARQIGFSALLIFVGVALSTTVMLHAQTSTGLVAAYSFNEGTGTTVNDASGQANNGAIVGATWTSQGKYGNALSFNGSNSRITVPDSASLHLAGAMTMEAWVNPAANSAMWRDLIYKGPDIYYLEATSSTGPPMGAATFGSAKGRVYGTSALSVGVWTHVAVTYDGSALRLYLNGSLVNSQAQSGSIATSTSPLEIGGDSLYGQYFSGLIDEVRVYNTALSQAAIQSDMNTAIGGGSSTQTVAVSVSPQSATLTSGGTQQFTATVTGTTNTAVTWTATGGTISSSGLFTAPTVSSTTTITVTAKSQADSTKSASATVTVNPAASSGTAGLVAAYSFNEGSGTTVADSSGNGNNGTLAGATWTTNGKYGNALKFGGSSRVDIPDRASLHLSTAMTLEAWVNPSNVASQWNDVIYKGNDVYYLEASSTQNRLPAAGGTWSSGHSSVFGTSALPSNSWTHIAATYDGSAVRLYVNGTQVASQARTGTLSSSSNPLQIGGDSIYGQYFNGVIDEIRVYNTALSAAQIQNDMVTPLGASGGGGGGGGTNVSVSISPTSASVVSGGTQQFTATVTGSTNTSVTWTATAGTVSTTGLFKAPTVTSTTSVTVTATSVADTTKSASAFVTVNPQSTGTAIPTYVRGAAGPYNDVSGGVPIQSYWLPLPPLPAGSNDSGNAIAGYIVSSSGSWTVSGVDATGRGLSGGTIVYPAPCSSGMRITPFVWYNIPNGIATLRFSAGSTTTYAKASAYEFYNVQAAASPVDKTVCTPDTSTSTPAASSAITGITTSGELYLQFAINDGGPGNSSCAPGSQANIAWKMRECMTMDSAPTATQFGVYNSTANWTPSFGPFSSTATWMNYVISLKPASAGSAPVPGAYVGYMQHDNTSDENLTSVRAYYPVMGNAVAMAYLSGCDNNTLSSCAYPTSGTFGTGRWTLIANRHVFDNSSTWGNGSGGVGDMWYVEGVTPNNYATTWSLNPRSSSGSGSTFMYFDIFNAAPSSILDTGFGSGGLASAIGYQDGASGSGPISTFTAAPSGTNEVCLFTQGVAQDSVTGITAPTGAVFESVTWGNNSPQDEPNLSHADENNGWAVWVNGTSTASITPRFTHNTINGSGTNDWISLGSCFKTPASQ